MPQPSQGYYADRESQRQQAYQDQERALAADILSYGGDQRRIAARQRQFAIDRAALNADFDKSFDPYGWQKQQFEQARAAYAPENYQPPQAVVDNYAPLRAEIAANNDRVQQSQTQTQQQAAAATPDPAPRFDRSGNLVNQTGVLDFDAARRSALDAAQRQFQPPAAVASVAAPARRATFEPPSPSLAMPAQPERNTQLSGTPGIYYATDFRRARSTVADPASQRNVNLGDPATGDSTAAGLSNRQAYEDTLRGNIEDQKGQSEYNADLKAWQAGTSAGEYVDRAGQRHRFSTQLTAPPQFDRYRYPQIR